MSTATLKLSDRGPLAERPPPAYPRKPQEALPRKLKAMAHSRDDNLTLIALRDYIQREACLEIVLLNGEVLRGKMLWTDRFNFAFQAIDKPKPRVIFKHSTLSIEETE